jgi:hypothetical protein
MNFVSLHPFSSLFGKIFSSYPSLLLFFVNPKCNRFLIYDYSIIGNVN